MQRLKTRAQFQAVLAGATVARTAHFALHRCALDSESSAQLFASDDVWLGAMVPKRWARRAVTRNAIKRQIYSVSALPHAGLPRAAHVVRLKSAFDRKEFVSASSERLKRAVRAELELLLERAARPAPARAPAAPPARSSP
ncbi:ribonuclease P protein component [Variovorax paradoxus]|jgi:ribonuclease P protein component|uniref:ribonuclease P protein component n=1 Tax=Variovorax TaxID=34072 RepID=UPI0006E615D0|nr:ribonuclease P protein component [Variovorax sp. CY25R-8]KPU98731.1 ribonuclease P protein component [Variovorax paradoxus]KPV07596.1 ribonuclease P protein component [Variovorax paradoxus]KPV08388.1 ribonuclease P protein component [Variovorax paradoxus]KPV25562.1 ribonuclease P protein component [Variovorax paradoxus]KPV25571.1 ribonuclease P protein component [Variovorax paradoxus]